MEIFKVYASRHFWFSRRLPNCIPLDKIIAPARIRPWTNMDGEGRALTRRVAHRWNTDENVNPDGLWVRVWNSPESSTMKETQTGVRHLFALGNDNAYRWISIMTIGVLSMETSIVSTQYSPWMYSRSSTSWLLLITPAVPERNISNARLS